MQSISQNGENIQYSRYINSVINGLNTYKRQNKQGCKDQESIQSSKMHLFPTER